MKDVSIIYFDDKENIAKDNLMNKLKCLKRIVEETLNTEALVIPKNYDIIKSCSIDQLKGLRDLIDSYIHQKEIENAKESGFEFEVHTIDLAKGEDCTGGI